MKVLSISTDRNIFKKDSAVRARMIKYGTLFDELHIVVFTKNSQPAETEKISGNIWVYPTKSWTKWLFLKDAKRIGSSIIKTHKFEKTKDVVTVQDPFETGLVGLKLKRNFNLPLHVQIHTDFLNPYFKTHSLSNWVRVMMAQRVISKADGTRVVSERIRFSLERSNLTQKPIMVLPVFVDIAKFEGAAGSHTSGSNLKEKYPQFNFIILMASRLTTEKNIPLAFGVMQKLVEKYPRAGLVVVGEGPLKKYLLNLTKKLNIHKNVVFENWQNDLTNYYRTANIFLSTSQYEGYGLSMVEATASHCLVVATDAGVAPELLGNQEGSLVCPVGDANCLSEKIEKLISDTGLRESLVHEAFGKLDRVVVRSESGYLKSYKESIMNALQKE